MNDNNSCGSSSPIRVHFSDVTNKKTMIDDDHRWKVPNSKYSLFFFQENMPTRLSAWILGAPKITIDNDENENDAWNEYRHLFETNRSQMLNLSSSVDNYLLRHSSANTSLSESTSLEPMVDNHDDIFSMIEQAGITFGMSFTCHRKPLIGDFRLCTEALGGSSSADLLGSTSGYHSYEPSPFNHRSKRSSLLDPSAAEFNMEIEPPMTTANYSVNRSSCHTDQPVRRSSRSQHNQMPPRISTSCKFRR